MTNEEHTERSTRASGSGELSRRGFLKGAGGALLGSSAVATGLLGQQAAAASDEPVTISGRTSITLQVNGHQHRVEVEPRTTLLEALRDGLRLTGSKEVCDRGQCGACTVLLDGRTVLSCMVLAVDVGSAAVTTVEGLGAGGLSAVQQAFVDKDGLMCGFCTPGMVMAAEGLLRQNPDPTREQIRAGMAGNLCRCGAYPKILEAVETAAAHRR